MSVFNDSRAACLSPPQDNALTICGVTMRLENKVYGAGMNNLSGLCEMPVSDRGAKEAILLPFIQAFFD